MRIVSLLPAATEILFAIGAGDDVVGVTFECNFPQAARQRRIVSTSALPAGLDPAAIDAVVRDRVVAGEDLYHLERDALADLDADLVITQDLCAVCALDVAEVSQALDHLGSSATVLTSDPSDIAGVLASIGAIGAATGRVTQAEGLIASLRSRLAAVGSALNGRSAVPTAILEWTDPPYAPGHWVPDMIGIAGGRSVLGVVGGRSVPTSWDAVRAAAPEVIVCAPCGYGLDASAEQGVAVLDAGALPVDAQIWAMDSDGYVVRPGPRLVDGIETLAAILHPDVFGAPTSTCARRLR